MEDSGKEKKKADADNDIFDAAIQAINDAQAEAALLGIADSPTPPYFGLSKEAVAAMAQQNNNVKKVNISPPRSPMSRLSPLGPSPVPHDKLLSAMPMLGLQNNSAGMSTKSINSWLGGGGGGNLRPAVGERGASKRHNRMVSWGIDGAPPNLAKASSTATGGDLSLFSNERGPSKITLQSVLNTSPYESEAETYLQRTLDESDPTTLGPSLAQQTILGSVPAEATPAAFTASATLADPNGTGTTGASSWGKLKTKVGPHHRVKSTAESLFFLAMDFAEMEGNKHFEKSKGGSEHDSSGHRKATSTAADTLADAGATLIRRNRSDNNNNSSTADSIEDGHNAISALTGASRPALAGTRGRASLNVTQQQPRRGSLTNPELSASMEAGRVPEETSDDDESSDQGGTRENNHDKRQGGGEQRASNKFRRLKRAEYQLKANYKDFEQWLKYDQLRFRDYFKFVVFYLILPLTAAAAILFYVFENPPCGTSEDCALAELSASGQTIKPTLTNSTSEKDEPKVSIDSLRESFDSASISYCLLFVVRQCVTLTLAKLGEAVLIEYLALRTRVCVKLFGPMVTLVIVQSKGWPMVSFLWAFFDYFLLYGDGKEWPHTKHWMYWQNVVELFNGQNPAGSLTSSEDYRTILIVANVIAVLVTFKRFWLGIFLGRQTFARYAEDLAKLIKKALLVGRVATLALDIERRTARSTRRLDVDASYYDIDESSKGNASVGEDETKSNAEDSKADADDIFAEIRMSSDHKGRIIELLGAFEDPTEVSNPKDEHAAISAIIQFRTSLSMLNTPYPFGSTFGPAGTRGECIESIEAVYNRLLLHNPREPCLHFNTIAALAVRNDGQLDEPLLKELVKLFRPDRDGTLRLLDFAKSIDTCYKDIRLLRASVASHSRMDKAFEGIMNVMFYFVLFCIVLAVMGMDPFVLFASISGFVLGFAFMIGSAASKYFEGVLLILVRHPYDVGDRIAVSNVDIDTPPTGSSGWTVKDVDLFTTTVIFGTTNEVATYSNGSLASSRIVNATRSPKATLYFLFKFPIDTPYNRIKIFHSAIDKFVKARPREWIGLIAFRNTRVEADAGFVEYIIICQHRESWQEIGALLNSKAEVASFALELMKKMKMRYVAPPMPVDLTLVNDMSRIMEPPDYSFPDGKFANRDRAETDGGNTAADIESVEAMFR